MFPRAYTIRPDDVGKAFHQIHGRTWPVSSWIGAVLPGDVGKRVYLVGDCLKVENDEQFENRKTRTQLYFDADHDQRMKG